MALKTYQGEFIDFALAQGALRFGSFVLKSGRESPYFFDSGRFRTGSSLARLGRYYAAAIADSGLDPDSLYGAAYKGIPLVAAAAIALSEAHGRDLPWCFNRKEAKDHGEGGRIVGAEPRGRVLIVDDVISAGTSVRESVALIRAAGATPVGLAISLDREERGRGERSAVQEVEQSEGLRAASIVGLRGLIEHLEARDGAGEGAPADLARMRDYLRRYGAAG